MNSVAERQLLSRCQRGEDAAWDELFERHYAAAGRFVFQLGYDFSREDVEEICQETFLSVVRNLDQFRGGSQFQTWLFRIAANKAHDFRQRQQAAKRGGGLSCVPLHPVDAESELTVDPASPRPGPDCCLMNAEKMALVGKALAQLDEGSRELIELRYFGDLGYEEIGRCLALKTKTVSSRLSRSLDELEKILRRLLRAAGSVPVVGQ